MNRLRKLKIEGFKSIRSAQLDLRHLDVLIGANGAGKSNLISFFTLINYMSSGSLQSYVARQGGAHSLLYQGPKKTPQIVAQLGFETDTGLSFLTIRLMHGAPDTLIFGEERILFGKRGLPKPQEQILGTGHKESLLEQQASGGNKTAYAFRRLLHGCQVFQFHDTSAESRIRQGGYLDDNRYLRRDAGNLAAFLYRLQETNEPCYRRIVATIRQVTPLFEAFDLSPDALSPRNILLNWREQGSDYLLGPHQLSDGSLRAMALISLLLQPEGELPDVILIDEPELGLHPAALQVLASLLRSVSVHSQVIVATQSVPLINSFTPSDLVVVERGEDGTTFRRLDSDSLREWLDEYTLGELWEKNVIGGRP